MIYFLVEMNRGETHRNTGCPLERGEVSLSLTEGGTEEAEVSGFHQAAGTRGMLRSL